jgi:hypothetical protein
LLKLSEEAYKLLKGTRGRELGRVEWMELKGC